MGKTELQTYIRNNGKVKAWKLKGFEANIKKIEKETENRVKRFQKESEQGLNLEVVEKWERTVKEALSKVDTTTFPAFKNKVIWNGFFNVGGNAFMGDGADVFKPGVSFNLGSGAEFKYGGYLGFDFNIASSKIKTTASNHFNFNRWNNERLNVFMVDLIYGHVFRNDTRKYKPFFIGSVGSIAEAGKNSENSLLTYNAGVGFETDFLMRRKYVKYQWMSGMYKRGFYKAGIRFLKSFGEDFKGVNSYQVNAYLGIGLESSKIVVKNK